MLLQVSRKCCIRNLTQINRKYMYVCIYIHIYTYIYRNIEQYIPILLICDLFSRNLEAYLYSITLLPCFLKLTNIDMGLWKPPASAKPSPAPPRRTPTVRVKIHMEIFKYFFKYLRIKKMHSIQVLTEFIINSIETTDGGIYL